MYFWNIKKLKALLIERPLTEKEVLPYLIATMLLLTLVQYFPNSEQLNVWNYLDIAVASAAIMVGTFWLYGKNLSKKSSHFLQRYFALGWVVMMRFIIFAIPVVILMAFLSLNFALFYTESDATSWLDVTIMALLNYFYIGTLANIWPKLLKMQNIRN